jgi:uncharacterized membrane protein
MTITSDRAGPSPIHRRHPVAARLDRERADDAQLRIADRITAFAGSMPFVYLHVVVFALWMILLEESPWPTLTLAVSLEAIMLSTFVLIGQNRQAAFQQAKADHDFSEAEHELRINTEVTRAIHELTIEIRQRLAAEALQHEGSEPVQPPAGASGPASRRASSMFAAGGGTASSGRTWSSQAVNSEAIAATIGTPKTAPSGPAMAPPVKTANKTTSGLRPTAAPITRGEMTCWMNSQPTSIVTSTSTS